MDGMKIDFSVAPWEEPGPGVRFKAITRGGKRLRLVEFTSEFKEVDWCLKGHIGYVLEGGMEIAFPHGTEQFSAGDGIFILGGAAERHKASVIGSSATLILVEEA